ncbi:MAG: hypothetical protein FWC11_06950 [Firmicutes bacterium]|nr:hypothetical protein [Bacillota bacterium]
MKKTQKKNKVLSIITVLFLAFLGLTIGIVFTNSSPAITTHAESQNSTNCQYSKIFTDEYFDNVNKSIRIFDHALSYFKELNFVPFSENFDEEEDISFDFDDDFAGVFIDDYGFLNIGVVDFSRTRQMQDLNGQVVFRHFTYSYNYLNSIKNTLADMMFDFNIQGLAIRQRQNRVRVYIQDENSKSQIIRHLQLRNKSRTAVFFVVVEPCDNLYYSRNDGVDFVEEVHEEIWVIIF